jgi:hypothetical protein
MSPAYAPLLFVDVGGFIGREDPFVLGASGRLQLREFGGSQLIDDGIDLMD